MTDVLAEPFSQIFTGWDEANWAFDLLRETIRRLRVTDPYDSRVAITVSRRSGQPALRLNFGGWLVLGFRGPGKIRLDMTLLANRVAWDERLDSVRFERKEGELEVRSYALPLTLVRPMTSELQAAYFETLNYIAGKFEHWKKATRWKQHNPEIIEAVFAPEKRAELLATGLPAPDLRYERTFTAFSENIAEEMAEYEGEVEEHSQIGRDLMNIATEQIEYLISLVKQIYPNWTDFDDIDFQKDEIEYKQATIDKAQELLNEVELRRLIKTGQYEEFVNRLDKIGKDNNLLWRSVPLSGDLNILYQDSLDKATFCEAMFDLLYGEGDSPKRLERYLEFIRKHNLPNKWTFPTYFLFICRPETEMFVKPRTTRGFLRVLGLGEIYTSAPSAEAYRQIKQISVQLLEGMRSYGARNMVDVQSVIWVCQFRNPESEEEDGGSDEVMPLAKPFSLIFSDRGEAAWAFDLLRDALKRLGINNPDNPRFAITLRKSGRLLSLNFCNWKVLAFRAPDLSHNQITIPLISDLVSLDDTFESFSFSQKDDEPDVREYRLPMNEVRSFNDQLQQAYEKTFVYLAQRFENYDVCPWRNRYHQHELSEAIFDLDKREKLFSRGIYSELVDDENLAAEIETTGPTNPPFPLSQLAEETGYSLDELARWVRAIERKGQAVFYGPPGTGKTFLAEKLAVHLIGGGDGFVELVQFHPAYAYEDFIQGIRPEATGGQLSYQLQPGRFLQFCRRAKSRSDPCVLIIDEINRANLSRVFGELMYLLEYRRQSIPLAGGGTLSIPPNVRLIGTMNTADRSIALVDHALRRRFAFIPLVPNFNVLRQYHRRKETGFPVETLIGVLAELNRKIDNPHYEVGISFFLRSDLAGQLADIWQMEIEPYLEEYFFNQPGEVDNFRWAKIEPKFDQ